MHLWRGEGNSSTGHRKRIKNRKLLIIRNRNLKNQKFFCVIIYKTFMESLLTLLF